MVQTRAQERAGEQGSNYTETATRPKQTSKARTAVKRQTTADESTAEKRRRDNEEEQKPDEVAETGAKEPSNKAPKPSEPETAVETEPAEANGEKTNSIDETASSKIQKVIREYGSLPLEDAGVEEPLKPKPETILAMVIDAMLKSTRISHSLAQKAVNTVIKAGYHDIRKLSETTWDDRVQVLAEGGYNRYREQTSTNFGALIDLVNGKYDGDLNNLYRKADHHPARVRALIKEVKGLGDLGTDIFFNNAQSVWPTLAPFVDSRSLRTADEVGIGTDLDAIYAELKLDPVKMSKLANGLSAVRLEKKQGEVSEEE